MARVWFAICATITEQPCAKPGCYWSVQAVQHAGLKLTQMAFYKPGRVEAAGVPSVAVARPALVMLRPTDDGYILSVCNPENEPAEMTVELGEKLDGLNCSWDEQRRVTRLHLELPGGLCAGSTVTCPLTCSVDAEPSRSGSA